METGKKARVPVFRQIAADLRARIVSGQIGPNDRLPTELELAAEHGTTRNTVRDAYAVLIYEGLVEKRRPSGHFVREITPRVWRLSGAAGFADPWREMVAEQGGDRARQTMSVRIEHGQTPIRATTVGDLLHLLPQDPVACRSAVRSIDDDPVELTDVYVAYERVKDGAFVSGEDIDVYALMCPTGRPAAYVDTLIARTPLPSEVARLELPEATGVVEVVRLLTFGGEERPGMLIHSVYSAAGAEFVCART